MANLPVSGEWTSVPQVPAQSAVAAPPVVRKLNIVLPFIEADVPQVIRLLQRCLKLSGRVNYTLFLLPFKGLNFTEIQMHAERAFKDVQVIPDSEGIISDWKSDEKIKDAAGPNSMFRQAAWFFYFRKGLGPWLYLEPDCVPMTETWIETLEADHRRSGEAISGVRMEWGDAPYLNGVAIYPANLVTIAPEIVTRVMWQQHQDFEVAFDVAGAKGVLSKAHLTDKIQLAYRANFKDLTDLSVLKPEAVLIHGDRDGSLHRLLETPVTAHIDIHTSGAVTAEVPSTFSIDAGKMSEEEIFARTPRTRLAVTNGTTTPTISIADEIRYHCDELLRIVSESSSRRTKVIDELRKRKLIPKTAKIWNKTHR